ncbi:hypothetical protein DBP15_08565 [Streptomyces sp. CS065A]|nr:hypothetical protein DBP15_08565 [Streptomyces sp. CS065A]
MESDDRYRMAVPGAGSPGFGAGVPPCHAPTAGPPPGAGLRAVGAGLLNPTGLGLGYALSGRWGRAVGCWVATGVLLFAALPADPDGVAAGSPGWAGARRSSVSCCMRSPGPRPRGR